MQCQKFSIFVKKETCYVLESDLRFVLVIFFELPFKYIGIDHQSLHSWSVKHFTPTCHVIAKWKRMESKWNGSRSWELMFTWTYCERWFLLRLRTSWGNSLRKTRRCRQPLGLYLIRLAQNQTKWEHRLIHFYCKLQPKGLQSPMILDVLAESDMNSDFVSAFLILLTPCVGVWRWFRLWILWIG